MAAYRCTFCFACLFICKTSFFFFPFCTVEVNAYYYEDVDDFKPPLIVALPPVTTPMTPPVTSSKHSSIKSKPNTSLNALDKPPTYDALYAASDVISSCVPNIPSLQGVSGNNVYAVPNSDILVSSVDCSLVEFPRRNLRFVEVLGEGEFGEVSYSYYLNSCPHNFKF